MVLRNPTASSIDRAEHCPPSHYLPRASIGNFYAERGNGVHDFIVRWRELGRDQEAALSEVPDDAPHRALCEAVPLDAIPEGGKLEVALAYDPETDTARIIGYNIGRAYAEHGALPHEICGTADLLGTADGVLVVIDWKSGFGIVPKWQLRFLALAGCRALGLTRAKVCNWFLREDGTIHMDKDSVDEFDAFDLLQIASDLREVLARLKASHERGEAQPDVSGGAWCQYCECKAYCPLTSGIPKRALALKLDEPLSAERATEAWLLFEMLEDIAHAGKAGLREFAKQVPFPDGRGNTIKQIERGSTTVIADLALPALREAFSAELAERACERSTSQAAIDRALRFYHQGQKLAPLKRRALEAIKQRGGIVSRRHREVRPIKDAGAPVMALEMDETGNVKLSASK